MGSAQSTRVESQPNNESSSCASNVGGQEEAFPLTNQPSQEFVPIETKSDIVSDSDDDDSEEEEEDEDWMERLLILEDARKLYKVAEFFLHPELKVEAYAAACARCYFSRYSAPQQTDDDWEEERSSILEDVQLLKKAAVDYLHPELPVRSDPSCSARCYFDRPSGPEYDEMEEMERNQVLEDMAQLKCLAVDYLHPEKPVVCSDPFAAGRNYFTRPSAPDCEEEEMERNLVLGEMRKLKQLAVDYMHPELPVTCTDPCATGRNYFSRPSAEVQEDCDEVANREAVLEDMKELKRHAEYYLEPHLPVKVDPLATCRNFFDRPAQLNPECDAEEMETILEEAVQMKRLAVDYLCPERPVVTTDPFATGRNFFERPSAPESEDASDIEERELILAEMKQLKQVAIDYMHPEKPVVTTDPFTCGRNYFSRVSAVPYDADEVDEDDRYEILEELHWMKTMAQAHMHPELPVVYSGEFYDSRYQEQHFDMDEDRELGLVEPEHMEFKTYDPSQPRDFGKESTNLAQSPASVMIFAHQSS